MVSHEVRVNDEVIGEGSFEGFGEKCCEWMGQGCDGHFWVEVEEVGHFVEVVAVAVECYEEEEEVMVD